MVKKCIVEYDDNNNPIGIIELKEFTDIKSFKDFEELCRKNLKSYNERMAEEAAKFQKEKAKAITELNNLKKGVIAAMKGISYILGYDDYKEEEIIAAFRELIPQGEKDNEQED